MWHRYVASGIWNDGTWPQRGFWLSAIAYVAVPFVIGVAAGALSSRLAPQRPPRAWEGFFAAERNGWLRVRMKSGMWVGGALASGTLTSKHGEQRDVLLHGVIDLGPEGGMQVLGVPTVRKSNLLYLNGDEIEFFEFIPG